MLKLNKILYKSRTTELGTLAMEIVIGYEKSNLASDPYLLEIITSIKTENDRLIKAINRVKTESDLDAKDKIRDEKLRDLHYLILGYLHHPSENIKAAAAKLNNIFKHYGIEIIKKSYTSESSLIESMLKNFADPAIITASDKLDGIRELIAMLTAAQIEFEHAAMAFIEGKAKDKTLESATSIKPKLLKIINAKLIIYLRAMVLANEEKYGQWTRSIAQMIKDNNEVVKKRLN